MTHFLQLLAGMLVIHALADFPLQGDFLAKAKSPKDPIPGVPWRWAMGAHSMIHAGGVWLVTGSYILAGLEWFFHWGVDWEKCYGTLSFSQDQAWHIVMKVIWAAAAAFWVIP